MLVCTLVPQTPQIKTLCKRWEHLIVKAFLLSLLQTVTVKMLHEHILSSTFLLTLLNRETKYSGRGKMFALWNNISPGVEENALAAVQINCERGTCFLIRSSLIRS